MNLNYLFDVPIIIQFHLFAALLALGLGTFIWLLPKGTGIHKFFGRGFVLLMVFTAISAIFIREVNPGKFSLIHLFVPFTLLGAWQAVFHIRQKNLTAHMRAVKGLFFGALLIPGLFALMPERTIWRILFG